MHILLDNLFFSDNFIYSENITLTKEYKESEYHG